MIAHFFTTVEVSQFILESQEKEEKKSKKSQQMYT